MLCSKCGYKVQEDMKFCPGCGAALEQAEPEEKPKRKRKPSAENMMKAGEKVTPNIYLCSDGKYRWVYEMNLIKNPTVFVLVWKIFFFILLGIFAMILIVDAVEWGEIFSERFWDNLKWMGYFMIGMTVVVGLGYLVYAAIMGGKYIVVFEMDEKGINHIQHPKQVKKAEALAAITTFAGLATGNLSTAGAGMNVRTEMSTDFSIVRRVKTYPRRHLIKLDGLLEHNQVYAEKEDYEFVKKYIFEHCTEAKKK